MNRKEKDKEKESKDTLELDFNKAIIILREIRRRDTERVNRDE